MWFFRKRKDPENDALIEKIKEEQIDMQNIFSNISNRTKIEVLYKELCKLCHPDRFEKDLEKQRLAKELFDRLQSSKTDYNRLLELKTIINEQLIKGEKI
jgi:hypothetical protein